MMQTITDYARQHGLNPDDMVAIIDGDPEPVVSMSPGYRREIPSPSGTTYLDAAYPVEYLDMVRDHLESSETLYPSALVGTAEIAERAGVQLATVHSWRARHANFPAPVVRLATGPVWDWREVEAWLAIPRRSGRPRQE